MPASQFLLLGPVLIQAALARKPSSSWPSQHHAAFISAAPRQPSLVVALHASKSAAAPKNKKKNKAGGGFGTPKKQNKKAKDNSIAYPDLEPQVIQTLVPSPTDGTNEDGGALPEEMYDRLEEIYGLEKFNFGGEGAIYKSIGVSDASDDVGENGGGSSLFDDILSGGGISQQGNGNSALDNLLSPSAPSILLEDILEPNSKEDGQSSSAASSFDLNSIPPFQKFRILHTDPMVLAIDDFFTPEECDKYVQISIDSEKNDDDPSSDDNLQPMLLGQSQTVGKDSRSQAQRTSTTWFHYFEGVPELMAKASRLLGLDDGIGRWEEPQTVRYRRNEKFTWHLDALSPEEDKIVDKGAGQRVATLLVYLTDLGKEDGGATMFRDLGGDDGPLKV